jgi:hypothetical protein
MEMFAGMIDELTAIALDKNGARLLIHDERTQRQA